MKPDNNGITEREQHVFSINIERRRVKTSDSKISSAYGIMAAIANGLDINGLVLKRYSMTGEQRRYGRQTVGVTGRSGAGRDVSQRRQQSDVQTADIGT